MVNMLTLLFCMLPAMHIGTANALSTLLPGFDRSAGNTTQTFNESVDSYGLGADAKPGDVGGFGGFGGRVCVSPLKRC